MLRVATILIISLSLIQCQTPNEKGGQGKEGYNHLANESSPYLLQHAQNPVDWYPWGDAALKKAKEENKLLLVSIGYAACHWCHVMEHESFEDTAVARIMNENFVNIKVDREERPDIDDIYMTACQMANGRGCGWPLNCFALPDGRPVWAGTYFPKKDWMEILNYFLDIKEKDEDKLLEYADQLTDGIKSIDKIEPISKEAIHKEEDLNQIVEDFTGLMDFKKGGKKGAPKFPFPNGIQFLLRGGHETNNATEAAMTSLTAMANGGIYDHLGGGFARYSTDEDWLVPHFEKMLYDNGQLISAYSEAFMASSNDLYKQVVYETIDFVNTDLSHDGGGFYSSLDADSEGEEGKFYVWTYDELKNLIPEEDQFKIFCDYYNLKKSGNWEDKKNILHRTTNLEDIASEYKMSLDELTLLVDNLKETLLSARNERVRPGLDDKILASWNGLMLKGLVDAYKAFGEDEFLQRALKNVEFLKQNMIKEDFRIDRNFKNGKTSINGFLDDYATIIDALIGMYEVTFNQDYLNWADQLTQYTQQHFFDDESGFFFYTSDLDPPLIARKKEIADNVIPASNSMMARNLNKLGHYFYNEDYLALSEKMVLSVLSRILEGGQPTFYSNWCIAFYEQLFVPYEVAIVGEQFEELRKPFQSQFLPKVLFLGGSHEGDLVLLKDKLQEGQTLIYVCQNKVCKFPVDNVEKALSLMN